MTELRDDKPMWGVGEVLSLAFPAAAGMLGSTVMQFVDRLMVSKLVGPEAFSAQFVSAITAFVPTSLAMGIIIVVNTFVSQNRGAGRLRRCGQYAWHGLYLAIFLGALMMPLAAVSGPLFGTIRDVIAARGGEPTSAGELALQRVYFSYLILGMPLMLMNRSLGQFFYGIGRPWIVMFVTLSSVGVNVVANYVLITGAGPFPRLGLKGAAIGTLIGWGFGFVQLFLYFLYAREHRRYHTRTAWRLRVKFCRDILRVGWPAGVHFSIDILAWAVFNAILVGYFGRVHKEASAAATAYMNLSFMTAIGLGIACTALVGRHIGAGRPDLARRRAHAALLIGAVYMGLCGVAFYVFRRPMIELFISLRGQHGVSEAQRVAMHAEIVRVGAMVLICAAAFQAFDAVAIVFRGALRGAGDTLWPMVVSVVLSWSIIVGGGIAAIVFLPQLKSIGPWIAGGAFVIVLSLVLTWRFERGPWRKIDLLGRPAPGAPGGPAHVDIDEQL